MAVLGLLRCMGFSVEAASGDCSLVAVCGLLIAAASSSQASLVVARVLSSSGSRALEHSLSSWRVDLVAPWPVRSSQIRDQSPVSCIGKQILIH